MKKLIAVLFVVVLCALALTACSAPELKSAALDENGKLVLTYSDGTKQTVEDFKTIVSASLNEEMHLIVTYSDGSTEDKGYAGPNICTVTFVDYDDTVLATETTYAGLGVKAPVDPSREDYVFAGWDTDLTKITGDVTVKATYEAAATYTVTFKDYNGTVLKTETVISGKDATPPADPSRTDYKFAGWDGNYTGVTADVTVTATYVQKGSYQVTFTDYNGLVLDTVTVKEGATASTTKTPTRDGYTFKGWSGSLTNVTDNKTVVAEYALISADNVFDIAYKVSGNNVTVTLSLAGNVSLAGFEGSLAFTGMTATAVTANSANALANLLSNGTVSFAYTSATNVTKGETVLTVTLTKTADTATADLALAECFDQSFEDVSYKIIGESLKLK